MPVAALAGAADGVHGSEDLAAVIALLRLPGGKVVSATPLKGDDHIVTSRGSNRHGVFTNAGGRAVGVRLKSWSMTVDLWSLARCCG